jgi:hypothetical protein
MARWGLSPRDPGDISQEVRNIPLKITARRRLLPSFASFPPMEIPTGSGSFTDWSGEKKRRRKRAPRGADPRNTDPKRELDEEAPL